VTTSVWFRKSLGQICNQTTPQVKVIFLNH
jgi:hypothetical protein